MFSAEAWNELLEAVGHNERCPYLDTETIDAGDDALKHLAFHLLELRMKVEERR